MHFKIIYNSLVICSHLNKMYTWAYTIVICRFWISIIKDNKNWLLLFKNRVKRAFVASWVQPESNKKVGPPSPPPLQHRIVPLYQLTAPHFVKKRPTHLEAQILITLQTKARHLILFWKGWIQSLHPTFRIRFNIALPPKPRSNYLHTGIKQYNLLHSPPVQTKRY
jgi:hypothetical protein